MRLRACIRPLAYWPILSESEREGRREGQRQRVTGHEGGEEWEKGRRRDLFLECKQILSEGRETDNL